MAKKKGMKFFTQKQKNAKKIKKFILAFAAFLLVFAVISVTYIFKAYHLSFSDFVKEEESETLEETGAKEEVPLEGTASFILSCTDEERKNIFFIVAVYADLDEKQIRIMPISPSQKSTVEGNEDTILNHFRKDSQRGLVESVNDYLGIKADRYVISTESQFKGAINALGGANIKIDKRIDYKSKSFNLSLMPGEQSIKGETLLKYFRFLGMKEGINAQGELMCNLISQFISDTYLSSGRSYFSEIINNVDSDITIVDYSKSEKILNAVADEKSGIKYMTVKTIEELKK